MAKLVLTLDIPDDEFEAMHYPLEDPTAKEMLEFDMKQVDENHVSLIEMIDNLSDKCEPKWEIHE